jgi:2-phospho-L-lactate guanylyltransferase (CobY/MobA/RfbA family)
MACGMHDIDDETRREVLGEALMDELKAIREYVQDVPAIKADVRALREDVEALRDDMKMVKAAVHDISDRLRTVDVVVGQHEHDIRGLKRKAA